MANMRMKQSPALLIREMQIKTIMRHCLTSVRMAIVKKKIMKKQVMAKM